MEISSLVSGKNLTLAGSVFVLVMLLKTSFPEFFKSNAGKRLLPVLPMLLAVVAAFFGFCDVALAPSWQDKLMTGLLTGAYASWFYKVGRTTILGRDLEAPLGGVSVPPTEPDATPSEVPPVVVATATAAPATPAPPAAAAAHVDPPTAGGA